MTTKKKPKPRRASPSSPAPTPPRADVWAIILLHANGRNAGAAICGAQTPGSPAGDPAAWLGAPSERASAVHAIVEELAGAMHGAIGHAGSVRVCPNCRANLVRMLDRCARQLGHAHTITPSDGHAQAE